MGETQKEVTRRAGIVGLGTLASRILGLVRESVIAAFFPKEVIDVYQIAFMLPNSFRRLTAEGSFSISVISVFSKIWSKGDIEESRRFVRAVLGFSLLFLTGLTFLGVFGAEWLTLIVASGFTEYPEKFVLAVSLTRCMFPYVLLVSLMALAMGILNSAGRFFAPAFAPVMLNVAIIGSAVGLAGTMPELGLNPIYALAIGVLAGGVAQVVFQLPSLKSIDLLVRPTLDFAHKGLRQTLRLTGPMIFGAFAYQVGIIMSAHLASTLGHGAVMYTTFATRLMELPLAVLVMAISTAALPSLAALHGQGKTDEMVRTYNHSFRLALFVATPALVALVVLAEPVIAIIYQRGLFTHAETIETAACLRWMALGICSVALVRQTVPVFYAMEKVWIPVVGTVVYVTGYLVFALPLMGPFRWEGLSMALSIGATIQGLFLIVMLRASVGQLGLGRTALSWLRMLLASAPMAAAVYGISLLGVWKDGGNSPRNIGVLVLTVLAGLAVYCIAAFIFRAPELRELLAALGKRRGRKA
ncbi:MAG: murein biosynthesis integral membrane protein MurJ [Deltaproteobacteria bacterium]|nr:murein biosynthesis integral membrane protein MurJ [Deltaproteobacteria bacterium]